MWDELIDASGFMSRGVCGRWSPTYKAMAITSDSMYALAYLVIPMALVKVWAMRRRDLDFWPSFVLLSYAAFIFGCGLTHACQVAVWWYPAYRLYTVLAVPGALNSTVAVAATFSLMSWARRTPTARQWRETNADLARSLGQMTAVAQFLQRRHDAREAAVDFEWAQRDDAEQAAFESEERLLIGLKQIIRGDQPGAD